MRGRPHHFRLSLEQLERLELGNGEPRLRCRRHERGDRSSLRETRPVGEDGGRSGVWATTVARTLEPPQPLLITEAHKKLWAQTDCTEATATSS